MSCWFFWLTEIWHVLVTDSISVKKIFTDVIEYSDEGCCFCRSLSNNDSDGNENITSKNNCSVLLLFHDYSVCLTWRMLASCPRTKLLWTVLKQRKRNKNLPSIVLTFSRKPKIWSYHVVALQRMAKKIMYKSVKCRCRAIVFAHKAIVLWRSCCRWGTTR